MKRLTFVLLFGSTVLPAQVLVLAGDSEALRQGARERGWKVAVVPVASPAANDAAVKALSEAAPPGAQAYLAGPADAVLYAVSRVPWRWAAAAALGGDARAAIDSNRLFAGNFQLVPLLWIDPPEEARGRLSAAGLRFEAAEGGRTVSQVLDFLAAAKPEPYPYKIDCETGSGAFPGCYWLRIVKADPSLRNDVLKSGRLKPGSGAYLALGGFGYKVGAPGPGVEMGWLPEGGKSPLRLGDRLMSLGGKPIADARDYARMMDEMVEEKPVALVVQRGRERIRMETRIALPRREETVTVRVQAEFQPDSRELTIISRGIAALRLDIPPAWVPCEANWNGQPLGRIGEAGCWEAAGGSMGPCR